MMDMYFLGNNIIVCGIKCEETFYTTFYIKLEKNDEICRNMCYNTFRMLN